MMKFALAGLMLAMLAAPVMAQDTPPPPGGPGPRGVGGGAMMRGGGGGAMMRADTNGDGAVSRDEYLAMMGQRFDRMDLNHDGKITREEQEQVGRRMGEMRGDMPPPPPPRPQN